MKKIVFTSVLFIGVLVIGTGFEAGIKKKLTVPEEETRVLGSELVVQPDGNGIVVFNNLKFQKGYKYIVTLSGHIKPDLSNHSWGACSESGISKDYKCSVNVVDPFTGKIYQSASLPVFDCTGKHYNDFTTSCQGPNQFQEQFVFNSVTEDQVLQVQLKNNHSRISYHHECGGVNLPGGFDFQVKLMPDTKVEIVKVAVN